MNSSRHILSIELLARSATVLAWCTPIIATASLPVHARSSVEMRLPTPLVNTTIGTHQERSGYDQSQIIDSMVDQLAVKTGKRPRAAVDLALAGNQKHKKPDSYKTFEDLEGDPLPEEWKTPTQKPRIYHAPYPAGQNTYTDGATTVPVLNSYLDAPHVLHIDFNGEVLTDGWAEFHNNGEPIHTEPFSLDGDLAYFNTEELAYIEAVWQRVAEDFSLFNVNITTDESVYDAAPKHKRQRIMFTSTCNFFDCSYAGYGGDDFGLMADWPDFLQRPYTAAFLFHKHYYTAHRAGDIVSHEFGHSLGLRHDGTHSGEGSIRDGKYYLGTEGWASIMGVPNRTHYTTWDRGEYPDANNQQNDIETIASYLGHRNDEATRYGAGHYTGIIGSGDSDSYAAETAIGDTLDITVSVPANGANNLKARIQVFDANNVLVATQNPDHYTINTDMPDTVLSYSALTPGEHTIVVDGVGSASPYRYFKYGSTGQYEINIEHDQVMPVEPVTPINPDPINPIEPVNPLDPTDPSDPDPVDPTSPTDPIDLNPIEPIEPPDAQEIIRFQVKQIIKAIIEMLRKQLFGL